MFHSRSHKTVGQRVQFNETHINWAPVPAFCFLSALFYLKLFFCSRMYIFFFFSKWTQFSRVSVKDCWAFKTLTHLMSVCESWWSNTQEQTYKAIPGVGLTSIWLLNHENIWKLHQNYFLSPQNLEFGSIPPSTFALTHISHTI